MPSATLTERRDAVLAAARFTLDPIERLAALTAAASLDDRAIEEEYAEALDDLEAAR